MTKFLHNYVYIAINLTYVLQTRVLIYSHQHHTCADDPQLLAPGTVDSVKVWMYSNKRKRNGDKTEVIPIAPANKMKCVPSSTVFIFSLLSLTFVDPLEYVMLSSTYYNLT